MSDCEAGRKGPIVSLCHGGIDGMHFGRDKMYKKVQSNNDLLLTNA